MCFLLPRIKGGGGLWTLFTAQFSILIEVSDFWGTGSEKTEQPQISLILMSAAVLLTAAAVLEISINFMPDSCDYVTID